MSLEFNVYLLQNILKAENGVKEERKGRKGEYISCLFVYSEELGIMLKPHACAASVLP